MKLAFLGVIAFVSMSHCKIAGIPIISRVIKNKNYYYYYSSIYFNKVFKIHNSIL